MFIITVEELTLNWCGGEARSVDKLVAFFAELLGLGELVTHIRMLYA